MGKILNAASVDIVEQTDGLALTQAEERTGDQKTKTNRQTEIVKGGGWNPAIIFKIVEYPSIDKKEGKKIFILRNRPVSEKVTTSTCQLPNQNKKGLHHAMHHPCYT